MRRRERHRGAPRRPVLALDQRRHRVVRAHGGALAAHHEERYIAELDDLAYRVRLTEIRSDEVRRDLAGAARAASNGSAAAEP